ncbi:unnamed protein product [Owenia fusiformis]|uniref:Uncharacterized protein n=1 Tax=Owenia fusiformis TaxID=6347 RepID=A0A8J1TTM4_OWEFU|nr:unnamed protein product [Owenia fusiformis]
MLKRLKNFFKDVTGSDGQQRNSTFYPDSNAANLQPGKASNVKIEIKTKVTHGHNEKTNVRVKTDGANGNGKLFSTGGAGIQSPGGVRSAIRSFERGSVDDYNPSSQSPIIKPKRYPLPNNQGERKSSPVTSPSSVSNSDTSYRSEVKLNITGGKVNETPKYKPVNFNISTNPTPSPTPLSTGGHKGKMTVNLKSTDFKNIHFSSDSGLSSTGSPLNNVIPTSPKVTKKPRAVSKKWKTKPRENYKLDTKSNITTITLEPPITTNQPIAPKLNILNRPLPNPPKPPRSNLLLTRKKSEKKKVSHAHGKGVTTAMNKPSPQFKQMKTMTTTIAPDIAPTPPPRPMSTLAGLKNLVQQPKKEEFGKFRPRMSRYRPNQRQRTLERPVNDILDGTTSPTQKLSTLTRRGQNKLNALFSFKHGGVAQNKTKSLGKSKGHVPYKRATRKNKMKKSLDKRKMKGAFEKSELEEKKRIAESKWNNIVKSESTCANCTDQIGYSSFLQYNPGIVFHSDCFKCFACGGGLQSQTGNFSYVAYKGSIPVCKPCAHDMHAVRCVICDQGIGNSKSSEKTKYRLTADGKPMCSDCEHKCVVCDKRLPQKYKSDPFWDESYCPHHDHGNHRCEGCNRMGGLPLKTETLMDGRIICFDCGLTAVRNEPKVQQLWQEIVKFYEEDYTLVLPQKGGFPVRTVTRQEMKALKKDRGDGKCTTRGLTISEITVSHGPRGTSKSGLVREIVVLSGLPEIITAGILAHEFIHAWFTLQDLSVGKELSPETREGTAELGAYLWLRTKMTDNYARPGDEDLLDRAVYDIENNQNKTYSDGFKMIKLAYDKWTRHRVDDLKGCLLYIHKVGRI